jgi:hypothetical protein
MRGSLGIILRPDKYVSVTRRLRAALSQYAAADT